MSFGNFGHRMEKASKKLEFVYLTKHFEHCVDIGGGERVILVVKTRSAQVGLVVDNPVRREQRPAGIFLFSASPTLDFHHIASSADFATCCDFQRAKRRLGYAKP